MDCGLTAGHFSAHIASWPSLVVGRRRTWPVSNCPKVELAQIECSRREACKPRLARDHEVRQEGAEMVCSNRWKGWGRRLGRTLMRCAGSQVMLTELLGFLLHLCVRCCSYFASWWWKWKNTNSGIRSRSSGFLGPTDSGSCGGIHLHPKTFSSNDTFVQREFFVLPPQRHNIPG